MKALESISHLVPQGERSGIYVLGFDGGEQYVGQTTDALTRFASHRPRWADIATLDWHSCDTAILDEREQSVIAGKLNAGVALRNIKYARGPLGASPWTRLSPRTTSSLGSTEKTRSTNARQGG